ncbi:MAG: hypothetical protein ACI8UO_005053 [Verrucomicrobiales bacterium]
MMTGESELNWEPIEKTLTLTQERGCQLTFRVYLEYPGKPIAATQFLIDGGLKITKWRSDDGQNHTPNYEDPQLRAALKSFIAAFGEKYDGDPRIACLTAGLLGSWGEWHTYPKEELWASFEVQEEILTAYENAFQNTPILLRYPAKDGHYGQAANHKRPFGYHDDSFGWATLDTGKKKDDWYFIPLLKDANALEKWKTQPIGGELRPELWKTSFTGKPHRKAQDFRQCVEETHATWLMDSGLFEKRFPLPPERRRRALKEVGRMGYEFHISKADLKPDGDQQLLTLTVENRGVAPFYVDWPVELAAFRDGAEIWKETQETWKLTGILPGDSVIWTARLDPEKTNSAQIRIRVPNPMIGGKPLRFANREQGKEWLSLPISD